MTTKTTSITELIKEKLEAGLDIEYLEIINDSHKHIGHAGHDGSGESHFQLIIVSLSFEGYNRIQRHRQVYNLLDSLFSKGLHALSMKALTPDEYQKK